MNLVKVFENGLLILLLSVGIVAVMSTAVFVGGRAFNLSYQRWGIKGVIPFWIALLIALIMGFGLLVTPR